MSLQNLEGLEKYITILILDENKLDRDQLLEEFAQNYETVWAVDSIENAQKYLHNTNILIINQTSKNFQDRINFIIETKSEYREQIEIVVICNNEFIFNQLNEEKYKAIITACLRFLEPKLLKLWINELGKHFWIKQIIDNDPDEILIRAIDGTILFVNNEKERIFGPNLIGEKCFRKFELQDNLDTKCKNCPSDEVLKKNESIRTEREYITRADLNKHRTHKLVQNIDLVAAPLTDRQNIPRAIIEITRDITMRRIADKFIAGMENTNDWEKRYKFFLGGFLEMGIPRVRFYLFDDKKESFRLIQCRGEYEKGVNPLKPRWEFKKGSHVPTDLILSRKTVLIYKLAPEDDNKDFTQDNDNDQLYHVGKNHIRYFEELKKNEWIDIPLIAKGNKIFGKVTIDGWNIQNGPDNYGIEILERYCYNAGQIIQNAKKTKTIEQRQNIEEAILYMSHQITDLANSDKLLYNAVKLSCETIGAKACSIFIYDESDNLLKRKESYFSEKDIGDAESFPSEIYKPGSYITGYMFPKDEDKYFNNLNLDIQKALGSDVKNEYIELINVSEAFEKLYCEEISNAIFTRLIVDNKVIGLLRAINKKIPDEYNEFDFNDQDLEMFKILGGQIGIAIHNMRLHEESLRIRTMEFEAREQFKILFEKSQDGIVIIDPFGPNGSWPIIDCNDAYCKMNGYSREQLIDKDIDIVNKQLEHLNAEQTERARKIYLDNLRKNPQTLEIPHKKKDGREFISEASTCLFLMKGKEYVLGIDRDITDFKKYIDYAQSVARLTVLGNFDKTLDMVIKGTKDFTGCDVVILYTYDFDTEELRHPPKSIGDLNYSERIKMKKTVERDSIVYIMLERSEPYIAINAKEDVFFKTTRFTKEEDIVTAVALPLKTRGTNVGVMFIAYRHKHEFSEYEKNAINLYADQAALSIENAQLSKTVLNNQLQIN